MSSWCEVLIRMLALLQRKTLLETKNCKLKCLKQHYLTVQLLKNVAVVIEDTAYALFFLSPPCGIWQLQSPQPREFTTQGKKMLMLRSEPGGGGRGSWGRVGLGAAGIDLVDRCITTKCTYSWLYSVILCQKDQCYLHTVIPHMSIHCVVIWNSMVYITFFWTGLCT